MQVNLNLIQRPTLFQEFFTLELIWNNEYLTYIETSIKSVTSNICKIAKTTKDNIKTSLKSVKNKTSYVNDRYEPKRYIRNYLRFIISKIRREQSIKKIKSRRTLTDEDCIAFF